MSFPAALVELSQREAVKDTLYRAVTAIDKADKKLFDSAFTQDAIFDLGGREMKGLDTIHSQMYDHVSSLDTTHFMTNERVQVHGSQASMTASALAQHYRAGEGLKPGSERLLTGALYDLELVNETETLWKITHWGMKLVWTEGDMSIVVPT